MKSSVTVHLIALFIAGAACAPALALAACPEDTTRQLRSKIEQSVARFEQSKEIEVSGATRERFLQDFCASAIEVQSEKNIALPQVLEITPKVVNEFLGRESDPKKAAQSVGSILRAEFGAQGFSRPVAKQSARIAFTYTRDVDEIAVPGNRYRRIKFLLVPEGKILVQALWKSKEVCRKKLTLVLDADNAFSC